MLGRYWWLIVLPMVVALVVVVIIGLLMPVRYTATATLLAPKPQISWRWDNRIADVVDLRFDWRAEVMPLVKTEEVAQRALANVEGELAEPIDVDTLIASTDVGQSGGSLFTISVSASNPDDAALLTNAMAGALPEVVADFYVGSTETYDEALVGAEAELAQVDQQLFDFRAETGMGLGFSGDLAPRGEEELYGAQTFIKQELTLENSERAALANVLARIDIVLEAAQNDGANSQIALLDLPELERYGVSFEELSGLSSTDVTAFVSTLEALRSRITPDFENLTESALALQAEHAGYTHQLETIIRARGAWVETVKALERKQIELEMKRIIEGARVQVVDEATPPQNQSQPNWPLYLGLAIIGGLLGGLLLAVIAVYLGTPES